MRRQSHTKTRRHTQSQRHTDKTVTQREKETKRQRAFTESACCMANLASGASAVKRERTIVLNSDCDGSVSFSVAAAAADNNKAPLCVTIPKWS